MLLLLLLLHLSQRLTFAVPLSPLSNGNTLPNVSFPTIPDSACIDHRSIWDIIWSCLATTFACSWISVHPNVPGIGEKTSSIKLRRLQYMFWAIIAPEAVIFWAMRQWYGAQTIEKEFRGQGWSITHGHFLQMGGFVLHDGKQEQEVLSFAYLKELLKEGRIELPKITKEQIEDRSKSDHLAKALVTIQTSWFVIQSIARHMEGLAITKLELATLALGILNGAMYICWLEKPFDVRSPVPVYLLPEVPTSVTEGPIGDEHNSLSKEDIVKEITETPKSEVVANNNGPTALQFVYNVFVRWPCIAIVGIFQSMGKMVMLDSDERDYRFKNRVGTFYALPIDDQTDTKISTAVAIMGLIFGAIHCTGWNFTFPSFTELVIWRVCSATILGIAGISLLAAILQHVMLHTHSYVKQIAEFLCQLTMLILIITLPAYVLARLALVVEAFITLRDLQPAALATIEWVSFIPHI